MNHYLHAASLACLLIGIPLGGATWALLAARRRHAATSVGARPASSRGVLSDRFAKAAWPVYLGLLGLSAAWVAFSLYRADVSRDDALRATILYAAASAFAALAPWRPVLGPIAYVVASYALPREDSVTAALMDSGALSLLTILSAAALVVAAIRQARRPSPPHVPTVWLLLFYSLWIGVVVFAAMWNGHPIGDGLVHRTTRIWQAVVLFLVAFYSRANLRDVQFAITAVAAVLVLRAVRHTSHLSLEQNLAALVAITVPWTAALVVASQRWWARIGFALLAMCLVGLVVAIANRGSFVGLCGAIAVLWTIARWKWRIAAICIPALLLLALLLPKTEIGQRLETAYANGALDDSASARIQLWTFGVDLVQQYPIFGVGPENYANYLREAYHTEIDYGAHNIFVDVAAESGYPGLLLFISVWGAAAIALVHSATTAQLGPIKALSIGGLAGLVVYLVTGAFLSLSSLVLIFILIGLSLALLDQTALPIADPARQTAACYERISPAGPTRSDFDLAALLYAGLIVLGSLTPFNLHSVGFTEAGRRFLALEWWSPDFSSRVDAVSNMALFAPLGFLFMGDLACDTRRPLRIIAAAALVLVGSIGFGAFVEYLQSWFPQRTISANDVAAQLIGTSVGVATWIAFGQTLVDRWRRWRNRRAELSPWQKAIVVYLVALVIWWCWPLELSLHPVDLYHKYRNGFVSPFVYRDYVTPLAGGATSAIARLLLPAPLGWFLSSAWLEERDPSRAWRHVVWTSAVGASGLEMMRLMTANQMATGDQWLVTFAGLLLGAAAERTIRARAEKGMGVIYDW